MRATRSSLQPAASIALFCVAMVAVFPAAAQKKGGTLRLYHNDNPPSTSLHEEATIASVTPFTSELDILDTPRWYARLAKKDYTIGLNVTGVSVDDPDGNIVENYSCKSERNYTQYCNAEVDRQLAAQSSELDKEKRRKMDWEIERLLVEDAARPIILHSSAGNCWQPYVKNFRPHDNSQYNNLRFEEVWLEK